VVHSPKTEHHPGKDTRTIPLFPELRTILEEAFEAAPVGAVYVVSEKYRKAAMGPRGWRGCNLRTTMEKIIRRAGMTPWPRLFHNLRSSRETELCERFPVHVVTAWLGNTPEIARKHYLQVTDEHFRLAATAKLLETALQPALQQPAEEACTGSQEPKIGEMVTPEGQNQKARPCKGLRTLSTPCAAHLSPCCVTRSGEDRTRTDSHKPLQGNELGNPSEVSAAAGAAIEGISAPLDPNLVAIVNAWPTLPEASRQAILTIIREGDR